MKRKFSSSKVIPAILVIMLSLSLTSRPTFAGPSTPNLAIPDGEWDGTMSAYYLWELSGVNGVWTWGGDMHFFSATGELIGESIITGVGSGETDLAYAIGSVNAQIAIFGSSDAPQFQVTNGSMDFTVTAEGFTTEFSYPLSASETIPVPVKLITVTCSQVDGHWDDFMNQYAASIGGSLNDLSTLFAAVRGADLDPAQAPTYQEELSDLVGKANEFLNEVKTTHIIDDNKFQSLLTRAEQLAISLRKNNDCGFTKEWTFALPIAGLVAQLIDFAFQHPSYFTPYDLFLLTEAAIRTGAMGAGAVNPDLDADMKSKLSTLLNESMNDIDEVGGNCTVLQPLYVAAGYIGGELLTKATNLMGKYCA